MLRNHRARLYPSAIDMVLKWDGARATWTIAIIAAATNPLNVPAPALLVTVSGSVTTPRAACTIDRVCAAAAHRAFIIRRGAVHADMISRLHLANLAKFYGE